MSDYADENGEYSCMVTAQICMEQNINKAAWIKCGVPKERAEEIWELVEKEKQNGITDRTA